MRESPQKRHDQNLYFGWSYNPILRLSSLCFASCTQAKNSKRPDVSIHVILKYPKGVWMRNNCDMDLEMDKLGGFEAR
jgi:hypothetical protein